MFHAFAGESERAVAETVAEPLRRYVRAHMEFLAPISGGTPKIYDVDAGNLMQFEVERFYRDCALFGTVE